MAKHAHAITAKMVDMLLLQTARIFKSGSCFDGAEILTAASQFGLLFRGATMTWVRSVGHFVFLVALEVGLFLFLGGISRWHLSAPRRVATRLVTLEESFL